MENFSQQLMGIAQAMGCKYTLRGEPIAYEKVFAMNGLLPGIMRRADQLCSFCLGYNLGLSFERAEQGILNVVVVFNNSVSNALRLLCATDVLYEFMQQAANMQAIALDDLLRD